ncbi:hypothetical protein M8C17_18690 [Micromonospora sp. RHAY321]|uniref:hypothetical protein n=1 Tax=unclassified Micromonospora TaxID=2617518 RepID=UPI00207C986B|nr:hypothetical protein [Micromonospora sp. RHAY321]MCO1597186.1 hypothetical protein [Micromonospora sp. RHAY321]
MADSGPEPDANPIPVPDPAAAATPQDTQDTETAPGTPADPTPATTTWTPPPAPPTQPSHTGVIVAAVAGAVVLVLVACVGLVGGIVVLRSGSTPAASSPTSRAPLFPTTGASPTASGQPDQSEEPVAQGPQASAYPAEKIEDLNRVCDEDIYYPELPKRAGKAPHPVVLLLSDTPGLRYKDDGYYYDLGLSAKVEQTWASEDPRKVQMVACLDRVSTGAKIRNCKFDDPKPQTLPLVRTGWRLRVYEAATGRKLLDKAMNGDDQKCPFVVMVGADKKIYAEVSDRAAIAALRNLVTK